MEDFGSVVFWIIVVFFYILSSLSSSKKKKVNNKSKSKPVTAKKERTLDDILREIKAERQQETREDYTVADDFEHEQHEDHGEFEFKSKFHEYRGTNFSPEDDQILKAQAKLNKYTKRQIIRKANPYRDMFNDPEQVRKAYIMSQIFDRKY